MDNATVVTDLATAETVVSAAVSKVLETNGSVGSKNANSNKAAAQALQNRGILAAALLSPYTKGRGQILKEGAADIRYTLDGEEYTWAQVYDSVRLPIGHGWCTPAQWSLYTMAANETATDARELTRSEVTTAIEERMKCIRRIVERAEILAAAKKEHEEAQAAEDLANGDNAANLKLEDFLPKKGANNKKSPRDAANDHIVSTIRVLTREETPEFDNTGAVKALRAALVCLNLSDPTLDENNPANK